MTRTLRNQSGQALALFALSLLLVGLMTFFTISTGNRIHEKIKVQATADTAAYGQAVAQARAMNTMAMANRAIIGEYVSSLSVVGHISWMDIYEWTFDEQAELWQKLKADNEAECALYQACIGSNEAGCRHVNICCKGASGGCCDPNCDRYNCYAAACSVPDALFDTISNDWYRGFGVKSFEGIHSKWHDARPPEVKVLGQYAADYVNQAWRASDQGRAAFRRYNDLITDGAYARGVGKTVDSRMTEAKDQGLNPASMPGTAANLKAAVQIWPTTRPAPDIQSPDFDVFNEILTGTRGGGHNNYDSNPSDWETQHGTGPGYFGDDANALPGICAEGQFHPGPWPLYSCSAAWDENDGTDDGFKGGSMMLTGNPDSMPDIKQVNTGNLHDYATGDLGGQRALSSIDHAMTTASFAVDQIVCPGYPSVLPGKSLVCLTESGQREVGFAEVANDGNLDCMRTHVIRGLGDDPNYAKGYNVDDDAYNYGACTGQKTEVGFFRFNIDEQYTLAPHWTFDRAPDPLTDSKDAVSLFNQPFTYAATQLDSTVDSNNKPLPWDFQFGRTGGSALTLDQTLDEHGKARAGSDRNRDGTTFTGNSGGYNSKSYKYVRGFAAGLTYYHNPVSWREVPNLFNPYWRAKLSAPGANALMDLRAISKDDCEVGKELGLLNDTGTHGSDCN